jgi:ADP-ribosylglycohydrolase
MDNGDKNCQEAAVVGSLLGTAVGDSLGLPYEGLSRRRQRRLYPQIIGQRLIFGKGLVSDDTEHACMTAQAIIQTAGDAEPFARLLARKLRFWLLGLPVGIGLGTLRAICKLWLGFPPARAGVFSAGNGPAMRSPILGVCFGREPKKLWQLVAASTRLTHSDPKAQYGAFSVALAAALAGRYGDKPVAPQEYWQQLQNFLPAEASDFLKLMHMTVESAASGENTELFLTVQMGQRREVSGYIYHTVPAVIHCWLRHQHNYRAGITEIVRCGGDTDTTAAILGGIVGAAVGEQGIPPDWLSDLWEWPRSVAWMRLVGRRLCEVCVSEVAQPPIPLSLGGQFLRNVVIIPLILGYGFRRLLPPY